MDAKKKRRKRRRPQYKWCARCDRTLARSKFGTRTAKGTKGQQYARAWCKECEAQAKREYGKKYPERVRECNRKQQERRGPGGRVDYLYSKYGLLREDYDRMLAEQGGVCFICHKPPGKQRLDVDHCHATGKVRGLLCNTCNRGLGFYKDDPDRFARAAQYLREKG